MLRIFLDFETYYDKNYSLRKLSPVEYILNASWETVACAVAVEHEEPFLLPQDDIKKFLAGVKRPYAAITHNALFDACVLAYRYGIHPDGLLCTLNMSRALLLHEIPSGRLSLATVLAHLGLPPKSDFIQQMAGKHWTDLKADVGLLMQFSGYALNDVIGCREIFWRLQPRFPAAEALVLDRVIRMATQPILYIDPVLLEDYRREVVMRKRDLLSRVTLRDPGQLSSNEKFAQLLVDYGVAPPVKISPITHKTTYAFAKTDQEFVDLLEHDNLDVQALVAARLGMRSTIEETRSTRLISIALSTNFHLGACKLPVPLKYSGAHTHRLSGDWQLNLQNLSARKSKAIRSAIHAPPGYTIVAVDAAQIEARIVAWIAGQQDLLDMFAHGEDTYRAFAADIFHAKDVRDVPKSQRFIGKTCILGLGFGMSARKLYRTIVTLAREQNIDLGFTITLEQCEDWVKAYRTKFYAIKKSWTDLDVMLKAMARGQGDGWEVKSCKVDGSTVILPSGLRLYYDNLRLEKNEQTKQEEYRYTYGRMNKHIYGAKMLENITQALDRQHVTEAGIRTELRARKLGLTDPRVLLNIHDENIHCVPSDQAVTLAELALTEMERNVPWSEGLPLAAEVKLGRNLGEMQEWRRS
jgi:hypothetical protein